MARVILLVVAVVLGVLNAQPASAQASDEGGWKVTSVSIGSGESAIVSGLSGTIQLEKKSNGGFFEVTGQEQSAWLIAGKKFKLGPVDGLVGASGGHILTAPWVGPLVSLSLPVGEIAGQKITIGVMDWPAFFPSRLPDGRTREEGSIGFFTMANFNVGRVSFTHGRLKFLDTRANLVTGLAYSQPVGKNFSATMSGTWNNNTGRMMYLFGGTWRPTQ